MYNHCFNFIFLDFICLICLVRCSIVREKVRSLIFPADKRIPIGMHAGICRWLTSDVVGYGVRCRGRLPGTTEFLGALGNPIARASRVVRSSGSRGGLSVLGLVVIPGRHQTIGPLGYASARSCPPVWVFERSRVENESSLWQVPH